MNGTALHKFATPLFAGLLLSLTSLLAVAAPTISLSAPANTAKYLAPATVNVNASATVEAGTTITQVAFYANELLIGTDTRPPYSVAWANAPAGSYVLTAITTDSKGNEATSAPRSITVNADNTPPTVALTTPANNSKYLIPASLTVSANANGIEVNTPITQVEFYANGALIGTDTTSPYSISWASPPTGTYTITAKATDSAGGVTTSAANTVTITASDTPPTVTLSTPANNAKYLAPATVTLTASASGVEANTPISQVEFLDGSTVLATLTTSPYTYAWTTATVGTHSITARATDSGGAVGISIARSITITDTNTQPTVALTAPANNSKYLTPASLTVSANANGVEVNTPITQVEFYANGTLIGTDTTSPYSIAWANPPTGTYTITAKATDSAGGVTTSTASTVTITASDTPPTVTLGTPANNAKYLAPATVTLTASASGVEANTPISQVEFLDGNTVLATLTTSPYTYAWTTPSVGTHSLTARATDSGGAVGTSAANSITINASNTPPTVSLTAPANNSKYLTPVSLTISANANGIEVNTPITQVEFYANGTLIGTDTTSSYSIAWASPPTGTYTITAKATDSAGGVTTSIANTVTITASDTPPTVTLGTPANNAKYLTPATVTLTASASGVEANTPISQVEFLDGSTVLATLTASPYTYAWANAPVGTHSLTARATDSGGAVGTSLARSITITDTNTPPTVSLTAPANNSKYLTPASLTVSANANGIEVNTPITQVEFYANGTLIGTDTTNPYSIAWASPPTGTYTITAKATDSVGGVTTSTANTVTITASDTPPTVILGTPANNAKYLAPATVTLTASASGVEANTPITQVDFLDGSTVLATLTTSPYTYAWTTPSVGTHSLTARATDSGGAVGTSTARSITITDSNTPPTVSLTAPINNAMVQVPVDVLVSASVSAPEVNDTVSQ
uniref:beta strand repeat-containing protein n=1 Tax=Propionivibrio sp. TaxID=2212460 RepID=UPI00262F5A4C